MARAMVVTRESFVKLWARPALPAAASAVAAMALLAWLNRGYWFYADDFRILVDRRELFASGQTWDAIFQAHNGHPIVLTASTYLLLQELFGLHHPILFVLPMIAVHGLVVWCIGSFLFRHLRSHAVALAGTSALIFLAAGHENLLWAFQAGFVGALAFGLVHLLCVTAPTVSRWRLVIGVIAGVISVLTHGHGIVLVLTAAVLLVQQRRLRTALVCCGPPIGVFTTWYTMFAASDTDGGATWDQRLALPRFVRDGLVASLDGIFHLTGVGVLVLVVVMIGLRRAEQMSFPWKSAVAFAVAAVAFFTLVGFSRLDLGVEYSQRSKFLYVGVVLLTPIVFLSIDRLLWQRRWTSVFGVCLTVWIAVSGAASLWNTALQQRADDERRLRLMSSALEFVDRHDGAVGREAIPVPQFAVNVTVGNLRRLEELGMWPTGHVDDVSLLRVRPAVMLALIPTTSSSRIDTPHQGRLVNAEIVERVDRCTVVHPRAGGLLVVTTEGDSRFAVGADFAVDTSIVLRDPRLGASSAPQPVRLERGVRYLVQGWGAGNEVLITLVPTTRYVVCGVDIA